jgi:hypothetical protein
LILGGISYKSKSGYGPNKDNPYKLLSQNGIPTTLTEEEISVANSANLQMALQDRGMIQQVAQALKMTKDQRWGFGDFVESYKLANSIPNNATLSWKKLMELGKEFLNK